MERVIMTKAGYAKIEQELKHLKSVERPEVIEAIAAARALGDLSENAEYHAAKEKQGYIEGRISELEDKVSRSEVIDTSTLSGDTVKFGATVSLVDEDTEEEVTYQIVGADESDIASKKLSLQAPLARALMGKQVGDVVDVQTPRGQKTYEIEKIAFV